MQVSRKVDYAMRALVQLSRHDQRQRIADLAVLVAVPRPFLAKVMRELVASGLVTSQPGPQGGYSLAREPHQITFRDLVEAVDGPMEIVPCQAEGDESCALRDCCTQIPVWDRIRADMLAVLEDYSLAQVTTVDLEVAGTRAE